MRSGDTNITNNNKYFSLQTEKNRFILSRDLGEVGNPVKEPGSNISTQVELNKRQEQELARLKEEFEKLRFELA